MAETTTNSVGDDEIVYVALGENIEDGKSTLVWALQNLEASNVCILHVHRPKSCDEIITAAELEETELKAIREIEIKIMHKILDNYREICYTAGVKANVLHTVKDHIGEGIVDFVYEHSIKRLVMGAASDKHYSQGMTDVRSRKSRYVHQHAPISCHFWFVCHGLLIQTGIGDVQQEGNDQRGQDEANKEKQRREEAEAALEREKEEHMKTRQERDELRVECDNALRLTDELLGRQAGEASTSSLSASPPPPPRFYCEFSVQEIQEATHNYEPSFKICEGDYGSIYRGLLHGTPVAIQLLHQRSRESIAEFQRKIEVLSRVRHPNLVTFMGACQELSALVFEYLDGGTLRDRLSCKDETPPLSWKTRIRIASELCSVLVFVNSSNPHGLPRRRLDAETIFLDKNFSCRVNYIDIHREIDEEEGGETCSEAGIHQFGVIVLQLLTGSSSEVVEEVQAAIDEESLEALLDSSAGDWPFLQATQLAHLGLRCTGSSGMPDLSSAVTRILEPMKASCGVSMSATFTSGTEEQRQPPSYFVCPILQEVMKDPHVAADGFTYEAEAIKSWVESGHDTSPMTNATLQNADLVPNHSLRSAIHEWLQHP